MDASIIIPSYRSERTIELCLSSLENQNTSFTYEVIVVDSSAENFVDSIVEKFPNVKFVKVENRIYPGIARNIGAQKAVGELLVFIDTDIIVSEDWLANTMIYYGLGHDIFTGSIDMWHGKKNTILERLHWFFEFSDFKPRMKEGIRWCLPSSFLAVKKSLFDSEKFLNIKTSEDSELTIRLNKKGHILYFNPALKAKHIFYSSSLKLLNKAFDFGCSNMLLRKMHKISGSNLLKNNIAGFFVIPFFTFVKLIKISYRNITYNKFSDFLIYIFTLPLMGVIILSWTIGFYAGLLHHYKLCAPGNTR